MLFDSMKKYLILLLIFLIQATALRNQVYSWGFFGHKRINRVAVFTLPQPMFKFYKGYIDYVTEHSVDPDKRRHSVKNEAPRHYIDVDHFGIENMPRGWDSAVAKYSQDTLEAFGIVPWHVHKMYYWLVKAFREKDREDILKLSADLGHYIADAHVPLHTTENYNGQMSDQKGIHAFWESRLPELFADDYDYFLPEAKWIEDPLDRIWKAVEQSHAALDSVLLFEKQLTEKFDEGQKYAYEERGVTVAKAYSRDFSKAYHDALNGMVERRMRAAMHCIGSFWYSAWIEAGQPVLDDLIDEEVTKKYLKEIDLEKNSWKKGKWIGRSEDE